MPRVMPIGTVAKLTGVKVPTIRYYEEIGLLPAAPRTDSNRRTYDDSDVRRLKFIRHARELGFDLEAIRELLALAAMPEQPCADADIIARAHLGEIEGKITRLVALREELQAMIEQCTHGRVRECRVIEVVADHGECIYDQH